MAYIVSVGIANAAVRGENTVTRKSTNTTVSRTTTNPRTTKNRSPVSRTANTTPRNTAAVRTTSRVRTPVTARTTNANTVSRAAASVSRPGTTNNTKNKARTSTNMSRPARAAISTPSSSSTFGTGYNKCRDAYFTCMDQFCATQNEKYRRCACSSRLTQIKSRENLLSDTANQLQDFKDLNLSVIDKSAAEVTAITSASAGESIASSAHDTSQSAQQLANIGAILAQAKSQSLSTAGTLDIGGNIKQIWQTTDLADGANIANLTGEALYNAVHAQCSQMVAESCESKSTLNMVVSAYGMYIENDCTTLSNGLDSQTNTAKGSVRETEREMHTARLENYNAHNSTSINDCIANVRKDLTADTACGENYVHCLDVTGRYLNRDTGAPIYSANFYELDGQVSLSGNILTNQTNRMLVSELNRMRPFAESSLDTCRDIANDVWDEFVRQAITEIYQGQQKAIRTVKNECLDVVNACYDEQNKSLKDFSNVKEQLLLGQRLELSEELCREKLNACSNLYGGGSNGLSELVNVMKDLTDSKIAKECRITLQDFARDICAVPSSDTLHRYPYACRVYAPGEQKYAQIYACNQQLWKQDTSPSVSNTIITLNPDETNSEGSSNNKENSDPKEETTVPMSGYICQELRKYTSCNPGFYMTYNGAHDSTPKAGNRCSPCPEHYTCDGGTANKVKNVINCTEGTFIVNEQGSYDIEGIACKTCPEGYTCSGGTKNACLNGCECEPNGTPKKCQTDDISDTEKHGHECGDYAGSLYQRLVRYAIQSCVRPSNSNNPNYTISADVLDDVNAVMDSIRIDMGTALSAECQRLGGTWVDTMWVDATNDERHDYTGDELYKKFYDETGANTQWGYCTYDGKAQCITMGGKWVPDTSWKDEIKNDTCCANGKCMTGDGTYGADDCHDETGDVLLKDFYTLTLAPTTSGYCAEKH